MDPLSTVWSEQSNPNHLFTVAHLKKTVTKQSQLSVPTHYCQIPTIKSIVSNANSQCTTDPLYCLISAIQFQLCNPYCLISVAPFISAIIFKTQITPVMFFEAERVGLLFTYRVMMMDGMFSVINNKSKAIIHKET